MLAELAVLAVTGLFVASLVDLPSKINSWWHGDLRDIDLNAPDRSFRPPGSKDMAA